MNKLKNVRSFEVRKIQKNQKKKISRELGFSLGKLIIALAHTKKVLLNLKIFRTKPIKFNI